MEIHSAVEWMAVDYEMADQGINNYNLPINTPFGHPLTSSLVDQIRFVIEIEKSIFTCTGTTGTAQPD